MFSVLVALCCLLLVVQEEVVVMTLTVSVTYVENIFLKSIKGLLQ